MESNGKTYRISVGQAGREVYADVPAFHVEQCLVPHGAPDAVTGTVRALVHRLLAERGESQGSAG